MPFIFGLPAYGPRWYVLIPIIAEYILVILRSNVPVDHYMLRTSDICSRSRTLESEEYVEFLSTSEWAWLRS